MKIITHTCNSCKKSLIKIKFLMPNNHHNFLLNVTYGMLITIQLTYQCEAYKIKGILAFRFFG